MFLMILRFFLRVKLWVLAAILFLSSLYLYLFPAPNLTYVSVVLLHVGLGVIATGFLVPKLFAIAREKSLYRDLGLLIFPAPAISTLVPFSTLSGIEIGKPLGVILGVPS